MSQYSHLSNPYPEWTQIATSLPVDPEVPPSVKEIRRMLTEMGLAPSEHWDPPSPKSGLQVAETSIPVEGGSITARTYVPEAKTGEMFPLLVWFHGGAFIFGDLEMDDALMRLISVNQRVSCVNVDYRLAPDHPFPIPVNDCYHATQWAATNAATLSADPAKGFIVGGTSAGANLSAVMTLKARDDPSFPTKLTGQILQIPYIYQSSAYPEKWKGELLSAEPNKNAPLLTKKSMQFLLSHENLPAAYLQTCGLDLLRDEGFFYEKVLRESGVRTIHDVYPGQPHAFTLKGPDITQSKKWREDVQKGVEWLLQAK